jgi:hypothetical protein
MRITGKLYLHSDDAPPIEIVGAACLIDFDTFAQENDCAIRLITVCEPPRPAVVFNCIGKKVPFWIESCLNEWLCKNREKL